MSRDQVLIEGLVIPVRIGVHEWERGLRQPLRFDMEMDWNNRIPGVSDELNDALDYAAVAESLRKAAQNSSFLLLEALAEHCAELVLREFSVSRVRLKISKALPQLGMERAAVVIERCKENLQNAE